MISVKRVLRWICAASAASAAFISAGDVLRGHSDFVSRAEARIGRPLTPMSYAGVARRTTRRAVGVGAAGAAAAGAYYYNQAGPGCAQVVNSYGQLLWQCP